MVYTFNTPLESWNGMCILPMGTISFMSYYLRIGIKYFEPRGNVWKVSIEYLVSYTKSMLLDYFPLGEECLENFCDERIRRKWGSRARTSALWSHILVPAKSHHSTTKRTLPANSLRTKLLFFFKKCLLLNWIHI